MNAERSSENDYYVSVRNGIKLTSTICITCIVFIAAGGLGFTIVAGQSPPGHDVLTPVREFECLIPSE